MPIDPGYKLAKMDVVDGAILKYICSPIAPILKATHHTPNIISAYGLFFTAGSLWYLWKDDMLRFSMYFWLSYVLDCLDGYFARRYNMVTPIGDMFEHIRDILSLAGMILICCIKYEITRSVAMVTMLSSALTGFHVAYMQKKFTNRTYGETLDILCCLCWHDQLDEISSPFGVGVYMATLYVIILYLSGGIFLFVKWGFIVTVILYFTGVYISKTEADHRGEMEDKVSIPTNLMPLPIETETDTEIETELTH